MYLPRTCFWTAFYLKVKKLKKKRNKDILDIEAKKFFKKCAYYLEVHHKFQKVFIEFNTTLVAQNKFSTQN